MAAPKFRISKVPSEPDRHSGQQQHALIAALVAAMATRIGRAILPRWLIRLYAGPGILGAPDAGTLVAQAC